MDRICSKCKVEKDVSSFYKRGDSYRYECKDCEIKRSKLYSIDNKDKIKKYMSNYRLDNRELLLEQYKEYNSLHKEEKIEYNKLWKIDHKNEITEYRKKYTKERYETDPVFKFNVIISAVINASLKLSGSNKNGESKSKYLPYKMSDLIFYLESKFESWMTWDNHGKYNKKTWNDNDPATWTWQLDHIIPQADLPYTSMEDDNFKKCWSLENLRPLSAKQNHFDGVNRIRHIKERKS